MQRRLEQAEEGAENGPDTPACKAETEYREQVRAAVIEDDGRAEARRVRLSDLEQPAAADRRSQHAARRQQPVLLADHRVPGDQVPMGYTRGGRCRPASRSSAAPGTKAS